uniref:Pyrrolo-quinoline quinone repeat domain-containing protein n=1 Tax=Grammatophora oceanica TaxID=210454 RepID=A0A7S1UQ76_9STRA|mmetsp:Transcript_14392/g.21112  ORF Transcript_14392/g.21112 Transcript_14392/m.21112 type:complete len:622 (+) Transcript_14392:54-1919(+)
MLSRPTGRDYGWLLHVATIMLLLLILPSVVPQQMEPEPKWNMSASVPPMNFGNEVALADDQVTLIVTSNDGTVTALSADDGSSLWSYKTEEIPNQPSFSTAGVAFGESEMLGKFIITTVSSGFSGLDPTSCRVVALAYNGTRLWETITDSALEGECSGTPVVSSDGRYVFLTHNTLNGGKFTCLVADREGTPLFSQARPRALSPIGIFHNPSEGPYTGGENNSNDLLVFAFAPKPGESTIGSNTQLFAFQFGLGFDGYETWTGNYNVKKLLDDSGWYLTAAPVLANKGRHLYVSASESQFVSWIGDLFDSNATTIADFPDGDPTFTAPFNSVALSSNKSSPMLFAGTASTLFVKLDADGLEEWRQETSSLIRSKARVAPDDSIVYYIEEDGTVHAAQVTDGEDLWSESITNDTVVSDFALSRNGATLYVGTSFGEVVAWNVAEAPPTSSPSMTPSVATISPTSPGDTFAPTVNSRTKTPIAVSPSEAAPEGNPPCNVCGGSRVMTLLDEFTSFPIVGNITCFTFKCLGEDGFIPEAVCPETPTIAAPCGCEDSPTLAPSGAPSVGTGELPPSPAMTPVPTPDSSIAISAPTGAPVSGTCSSMSFRSFFVALAATVVWFYWM